MKKKITPEIALEAQKKIVSLEKEITTLRKIASPKNILDKGVFQHLKRVLKNITQPRKSTIRFTIEVEAEINTNIDFFEMKDSSVNRDISVRIRNNPLPGLEKYDILQIQDSIAQALEEVESDICLSTQEEEMMEEQDSLRSQIKETAKVCSMDADQLIQEIK